MTIGSQIADARRAAGLRQEDLAALAGITQHYLSGIERDRVNATISVLYRLAGALGVVLEIRPCASMTAAICASTSASAR
jgi:transcriptional regulator with XRE-family HTH domain